MTEVEKIESEADKDGEALMSPMPTIVVRSLRDDPNYIKCPRCWHLHAVKLNFDGLCDRCCNVLVEAWPNHESVPLIVAAREAAMQRFSPSAFPCLGSQVCQIVSRDEAIRL